jgi:oligoendopeptidase F
MYGTAAVSYAITFLKIKGDGKMPENGKQEKNKNKSTKGNPARKNQGSKKLQANKGSENRIPSRDEIPADMKWNLELIYADKAAWEADFAKASESLSTLSQFEGKIGQSASTLLQALQKRDEVGRIVEKVYVYASMRFHEDTKVSENEAAYTRVNELYAKYGQAVSFMQPELMTIELNALERMFEENADLRVYRQHLEEILKEKEHTRSAEVEKVFALSSMVRGVPRRTYELMTNSELKFGKVKATSGEQIELTSGNYVPVFAQSKDRGLRKRAFERLFETYGQWINTVATLYSGRIQANLFSARVHGYESPLHEALAPKSIPVSVYQNLIDTVNANLDKLHKYLDVRKRLLKRDPSQNMKQLHMYDLYVPLVGGDKQIDYATAKQEILEAVSILGPEYVDALKNGYGSGWVDVCENQGKRSGAYSGGAYDTNPYMLLNYHNKLNDAFTLAHESGHSMHSYLSRKNQPYVYGDYTIFVAEVASTLNEQLYSHYLLSRSSDKQARLEIINHTLESFRATIYRQTMFAEFELEAHKRAQEGQALNAELLSSIYLDLNRKYFGSGVEVDELIKYEWARIPHFYNSFYVYQYATSMSAAIALAEKILSDGQSAVDKYLAMLMGGCSKYSIDLLKDAGVDMTTPQAIQDALDVFGKYVQEFDQLTAELA